MTTDRDRRGPLRVAMVGDYGRPGAGVDGGVQSVMRALAGEFRRTPAIDLTVVTLDRGGGAAPGAERLEGGVRVVRVPASSRRGPGAARADVGRLASRLRALGPDVVHAHIASVNGSAAAQAGLQPADRRR